MGKAKGKKKRLGGGEIQLVEEEYEIKEQRLFYHPANFDLDFKMVSTTLRVCANGNCRNPDISVFCKICKVFPYCGDVCASQHANQHTTNPFECRPNTSAVQIRVQSNGFNQLELVKDVAAGEIIFSETPYLWFPSAGVSRGQDRGQEDDGNGWGPSLGETTTKKAPSVPTARSSARDGNAKRRDTVQGHNRVCLGCFERFDPDPKKRNGFPCTICGLNVCGFECQNLTYHKDNECSVILQMKQIQLSGSPKSKFRLGPWKSLEWEYLDISVVRALLFFRSPEVKWTWIKFGQLAHTARYMRGVVMEVPTSKKFLLDELQDSNLLREYLPLSFIMTGENDYVIKLVATLLIIFQEEGQEGNKVFSMMYSFKPAVKHVCAYPNAVMYEDKDPKSTEDSNPLKPEMNSAEFMENANESTNYPKAGFSQKISMKAVTKLKAGSGVFWNFGSTKLLPTVERARHLAELLIDCFCTGCIDPTEEKTYAGSLRCFISECDGMYVEPQQFGLERCRPFRGTTSYLQSVLWQCDRCNDKQSYSRIKSMEENIMKELTVGLNAARLEEDPLEVISRFIEFHTLNGMHVTHYQIIRQKIEFLRLANLKHYYSCGIWPSEDGLRLERIGGLRKPPSEYESAFPKRWDEETLNEIFRRKVYAEDILWYFKATGCLSRDYAKKDYVLGKFLFKLHEYAEDVENVDLDEMMEFVTKAHAYALPTAKDYKTFFLVDKVQDDLELEYIKHVAVGIGSVKNFGKDVKEKLRVLAETVIGVPFNKFRIPGWKPPFEGPTGDLDFASDTASYPSSPDSEMILGDFDMDVACGNNQEFETQANRLWEQGPRSDGPYCNPLKRIIMEVTPGAELEYPFISDSSDVLNAINNMPYYFNMFTNSGLEETTKETVLV